MEKKRQYSGGSSGLTGNNRAQGEQSALIGRLRGTIGLD